MPYVVTNNYTNLILELLTNNSNYNNINLKTYVNDSDTAFKTYNPVADTSAEDYVKLTYTISTSEYTVNDVISKFELSLNNSTHLWQTHEGIIWLLNGEEYSNTHNNTETFKFDDKGSHTIEAVFAGNDSLEVATTGKHPLTIVQPEIDTSGTLGNDGAYSIQFVNKNLKTLTYDDHTKIEFILTKGGVPVTTGNRNIEVITPKDIASLTLNNQGKASRTNVLWDCGTYTIGAYYQDETNPKVVTRVNKKITIKKGTPTISDNSASAGNFIPSSKYKAVLKFRGNALANTKVTLYVNGKANTLTTNKNGAIFYGFKKTGTYKLKLVYKGNKNLNKVELSRTITVVKASG